MIWVIGVDKQQSSRGANGDVADVAGPVSTVHSIGFANERYKGVDVSWIGLGRFGSIVEEIRVGNSGHGEGSSAVVAQGQELSDAVVACVSSCGSSSSKKSEQK